MWHPNQKRITPAEREHLERVRALGCVCCAQFGVIWFQPVEAHHLLLGGKRIGHYLVTCETCGMTVAVTTAGRVDDPRSLRMACKERLQ